MRLLSKRTYFGCAVVVGILLAVGLWIRSQLPSYPYGWSHCCLKGLGLSLLNYAETHDGHFPAGAGSPEASLSLLYQWSKGAVDAEVLRGKTVPVETVRKILEQGKLLGPETCGWHYVEGVTMSDDSHTAIVWDKVGLGHNGQDIGGGHSVWFVHGPEEIIPASKWPQFLEFQQELMAERLEKAKATKPQSPSVLPSTWKPKLWKTLSVGRSPVAVAFSPDGKILASGCLDTTIKLWDVSSGKNTTTLRGHTNEVWAVAFSSDGKTIASGSCDGTIKLWAVTTGTNTATLVVDRSCAVTSVAFSPDDKTLASGSGYSPIELWNVTSGRNTATLNGHAKAVMDVAFSPDGKILASGSEDQTIKLWDVATGRSTTTLHLYPYAVACVAFSPDGKTLASVSGDRIKLWDMASGKKTIVLHVPLGATSVAFSPDGKLLASGCGDSSMGSGGKAIKLWDVATGKNVATLDGHTEDVKAVAFRPDGKILASGSYDRTIKLWDVSKNPNK